MSLPWLFWLQYLQAVPAGRRGCTVCLWHTFCHRFRQWTVSFQLSSPDTSRFLSCAWLYRPERLSSSLIAWVQVFAPISVFQLFAWSSNMPDSNGVRDTLHLSGMFFHDMPMLFVCSRQGLSPLVSPATCGSLFIDEYKVLMNMKVIIKGND